MMKKSTLLIALAIILCSNAMAQKNGPLPRVEQPIGKMKTELSLSNEQVLRIQEMKRNHREEHYQLASDTTLTRGARMEKKKALINARQETMKEILSMEQYHKWITMKPNHAHRTRRPLERLKEEAELSDDQAKRITAINASMAQRFAKLRMDTTLTRADRMKSRKQIMEDRNAEIKKVLTEEQYEKFVALSKEKGKERRKDGKHRQRH